MTKAILFVATLFLMSCGTTTYYVVRHAEKAAPTSNMTSDVPLSEEGAQRAVALKDVLSDKDIRYIYSTNTIRTISTAKPLSETTGIPIQIYDAKDSAFTGRLKTLPKGNVLIVGHSNTVDDIVYGITGRKLFTDLKDDRYGDLFTIVRRGKRKFEFTQNHFGK